MLAEIKCIDFELGCHFSQTPCNIIASCGKLHGIMHQERRKMEQTLEPLQMIQLRKRPRLIVVLKTEVTVFLSKD